jgi:hypothetical protein
MTTDQSIKHDSWYIEATTHVDGLRRSFSRQIPARPDKSRTIPTTVQTIGEEWLADVVAQSDVWTPDAVLRGERCDYPYRSASYVISCNGVVVVPRSYALSPLRPTVTV